MKPASAKAKGRKGQGIVRDAILAAFPDLTPDDVRSTSSGANGSDILLSAAAKAAFPYAVECKTVARHTVRKDYEQAQSHVENGEEPLLVVKVDRKEPLAVVSLEHFIKLIGRRDGQQP